MFCDKCVETFGVSGSLLRVRLAESVASVSHASESR
jgi:hypothetical protein